MLEARDVITTRTPNEGDWLFEEVPLLAFPPVQPISRPEIMLTIDAAAIPLEADIWYWNGPGAKLKRIYTRSQSPDFDTHYSDIRAKIGAFIDADEPCIIVHRGSMSAIVFYLDSQQRENVEIEEIAGSIEFEEELKKVASDDDEGYEILADTAKEQVELYRNCTVARLTKSRALVHDALRKAETGDREGAAKAAAKVLRDVLAGATPSPVQGHNVGHSAFEFADKWAQLDQYVRQGLRGDDNIKGLGQAGEGVKGFSSGVGTVDGVWQAAGSAISSLINIYELQHMSKKSHADLKAKHGGHAKARKGLDLGTNIGKTGMTTYGAADAINKVAHAGQPLLQAGTAANVIAPIGGAVFGSAAATRSFIQTAKADKRRRSLQKLRKSLDGNQPLDPEVESLLAFAYRKIMRKVRTKGAEGATATVSAVGGITTAVLVLTAANAWNPVGWGFGIAVFLAGAGILAYKLWKRKSRKERAKKRGFSTKEFPRKLILQYQKCVARDPNSHNTLTLKQMLKSLGIKVKELADGGQFDQGKVRLAEKEILRHLTAH